MCTVGHELPFGPAGPTEVPHLTVWVPICEAAAMKDLDVQFDITCLLSLLSAIYKEISTSSSNSEGFVSTKPNQWMCVCLFYLLCKETNRLFLAPMQWFIYWLIVLTEILRRGMEWNCDSNHHNWKDCTMKSCFFTYAMQINCIFIFLHT